MQSSADWIRGAIDAHLDAERERVAARASGRGTTAGDLRGARARAALGTGEAKERLADARQTGAIDGRAHAALLDHLAGVAEAEVLARRGVTLALGGDERVVVAGGRERTLAEIVSDVRVADAETARDALAACVARSTRDRAARLEALADADERAAGIRARGEAGPDDEPADLHDVCAAFLAQTDDAAAELTRRTEHDARDRPASLVRRFRALAPPDLDAVTTPRARSRRIEAIFASLGLAGELARRVEMQRGVYFTVSPTVVAARGRATLFASPLELGVATERATLAAAAYALTLALGSPVLPVEHALPARASAARAMGALFAQLFTDHRLALRTLDAGTRDTTRIVVASATARVLAARHACAAVLADPSARAEDATRELAARALVLDPGLVPIELALPSSASRRARTTRARAALAALTWAPALRDRYDEDFLRNPRLGDFVRGVAARGGSISAEDVSIELGADTAGAARCVIEIAERAGG